MKNLLLVAFITIACALGGASLSAQNTSKVTDNKRTVKCDKHKQGNFANVDGTKVVVKVVINNGGSCCGGGGCCGGSFVRAADVRGKSCKKRNFASVRKASKKPTVQS